MIKKISLIEDGADPQSSIVLWKLYYKGSPVIMPLNP